MTFYAEAKKKLGKKHLTTEEKARLESLKEIDKLERSAESLQPIPAEFLTSLDSNRL